MGDPELEQMCEETITAFLRERYGFERIAVPTEAITAIIERDAGDLDLETRPFRRHVRSLRYTIFRRGEKPRVVRSRASYGSSAIAATACG